MSMENVAADDLTRINGIGRTYKDALNAVGVRRFAQLADFSSPEVLHTLVREQAGVTIPLWKIEKDDWLGQAVTLREQTAERKSGGGENRDSGQWRQHAGFSIFFDSQADTDDETATAWQTRTYHDESGEEQVFAGVDTEAWVAWILEEAKLPDTAGPAELVFVAPQPEEPVLRFISVEVSESRPSFGVLEGALTVAVSFRMIDEGLADARSPYRLEVYLVEMDRQEPELAATAQGRLELGETDYGVQVEFPFPDAGGYRLTCVLFLLPPANFLAVHDKHVLHFVQ